MTATREQVLAALGRGPDAGAPRRARQADSAQPQPEDPRPAPSGDLPLRPRRARLAIRCPPPCRAARSPSSSATSRARRACSRRLGDRYSGLLERHREIVRAGFARADGVEVSTQGDSFFAVFPQAPRAITAAVADPARDGRRALARTMRRCGSGSGSTRARRASSPATTSASTSTAPRGSWRPRTAARSSRPQATCAGVGRPARRRDRAARPRRAPPARPVGRRAPLPGHRERPRGRLPAAPHARPDAQQPADAADDPHRPRRSSSSGSGATSIRRASRLLTLTGPGGIGKTRLALQAAANQADRVQDGVYFVDLADVDDADGRLRRDRQRRWASRVPAGSDLRRAPRRADRRARPAARPRQLRAGHVAPRTTSPTCSAPVRACALIVTSRESLRVRGEQLIDVAPLSFPDAPRELATRPRSSRVRGGPPLRRARQRGATRLHADRRERADRSPRSAPDSTACRSRSSLRRRGCACSRSRSSATGSARGLDVLRGGARDLPRRQRTLRDTIAWSHDLLDDDERDVFAPAVGVRVGRRSTRSSRSRRSWTGSPTWTSSTSSRRSSTRASSAERRTAAASASRCSRRSASSRASGSTPIPSARSRGPRSARGVFLRARRGRRADGSGRARAAGDARRARAGARQPARSPGGCYVERADLGRLHSLLDVLWPLHETRGWYHGALALLNDLLAVLPTLPPAPGAHGEGDHAADQRRAGPARHPRLHGRGRAALSRGDRARRGGGIDPEAAAGAAQPRELPPLPRRDGQDGRDRRRRCCASPSRRRRSDAPRRGPPDPRARRSAFLGQWREGLDHLDRALELFDPDRHALAGFRLGPNPGVAAAAVSALLYWQCGFPETGDRRAARALELAARIQHPYSLAYATFHVGLLDLWSGRIRASPAGARPRCRPSPRPHDYGIWSAAGLVLEGVAIALLDDPDGRAWPAPAAASRSTGSTRRRRCSGRRS